MARVVDSDVLIAIERRGQVAEDVIAIAEGEAIAIAAVSAAEVLAGVELRRSLGRLSPHAADLEEVLQRVRILPFEVQAARMYARLYATLRTAGQSIGGFDLQIAATALANDHDVVTFNVREFSRVPGLQVIVPDW